MKNISKQYYARCKRKLESIGAPLKDWRCVFVEDHEEADFTCELCGCSQVRFVHVMEHDEYNSLIRVGCICAGVMEDDILAAITRERTIRNWYDRRKRYMKRVWDEHMDGMYVLKYKRIVLTIEPDPDDRQYYQVMSSRGDGSWKYKNERIAEFQYAQYAAFELVDPRPQALK